MKCPSCGKKIKWRDLKKDHCRKCGYKFEMIDFLTKDIIEKYKLR